MPDSRRTAPLGSDSVSLRNRIIFSSPKRTFVLAMFWRMPTPKQMEKLAAEAARRPALAVAAPNAPLPAEYWEQC
jgi:hypothetical protein